VPGEDVRIWSMMHSGCPHLEDGFPKTVG